MSHHSNTSDRNYIGRIHTDGCVCLWQNFWINFTDCKSYWWL